jgi:hypothetical protein
MTQVTEDAGDPSKRHRGGQSMGMISVFGKTYRIILVNPGTYDAVRLLDDVRVGSFADGPALSVDSSARSAGDETLLRQIARAAKHAAKMRWTSKAWTLLAVA